MAGKVKMICEEKIVPIIKQAGYDVIEVEYVKKSDGMNLTFYIDNDDGITLIDCEKVSKLIDPLLEELNPTDNNAYILNVSSPGIDRPLKTERDFFRNLEKEISITLFAKKKKKKKIEGILKSFDEKTISLLVNNDLKQIEKTKIAHIVPIIKF